MSVKRLCCVFRRCTSVMARSINSALCQYLNMFNTNIVDAIYLAVLTGQGSSVDSNQVFNTFTPTGPWLRATQGQHHQCSCGQMAFANTHRFDRSTLDQSTRSHRTPKRAHRSARCALLHRLVPLAVYWTVVFHGVDVSFPTGTSVTT